MVCPVIFVGVSVLIAGSVIVRSAVGMANWCLGAEPSQQKELDEWIGYRQALKTVPAIPEPSVGMGMLCVALILFIDFLASIVMRALMGISPFDRHHEDFDDAPMIFAHIFACVLCYPLCASLLTNILGARFSRACLVLFWIYAIPVAIVLAICVFIFGVF